MTRRRWILLAVVLIGCGGAPVAVKDPLPETGGEWKRVLQNELPLESAPPAAKKLNIRRIRYALYRGPVDLSVTVYEMPPGTSFELMQKWQVKPRTLPFHTDSYLYVIESETDDRARMKALADLLAR